MSKTKLLGIDPGLMTGVFCVDISDLDNVVPVLAKELSVEEFHDFIEDYLVENKGNIQVTIEDYIITARTAKLSQQPWSLRLIGVVAYLCYKHNVPLKIQKPRDKEFASNEKLKKIGFWTKGGAGHSLDAGRHCLVWLIDRYPQLAKNLI